MEKYLNYYYNIKVDKTNIQSINQNYKICGNNYNYMLICYEGDIKYLEDILYFNSQLIQLGVPCNQIVLTNNNELFMLLDKKRYVLLKYKKEYDREITLNDILKFNYFYIEKNRFDCSNWKKLWEAKMDYFEYQMNQFGYKHPLLRESFGYYSGYVELALELLNDIKIDNLRLSHRRIKKNYILYNLYDPFNLIIDSRVRDFAELFKDEMFDEDILNKLSKLILDLNLNNKECKLLFVRLLYPTFYFDRYEKIMENNLEDEVIKPILKKTNQYELTIKKVYNYLKQIVDMPLIEWLEN